MVNDDDIEKVIAQIGKPEVIEEQRRKAIFLTNFAKKSRPSFSSAPKTTVP